MFVGPVFTRELVTAPRRVRLYVARAAYVSALLILASTVWLVLAGIQVVRNVGDLARFGATVFQILAPLQLAVMLFFSALLAASAVAQEKDRRTLDLLLLTRMSNSELVLGKLMAAMLGVLGALAAALPLFMISVLFGGISFGQIARVFSVTLAAAVVAGSLGSTLALWREKTFQTLAMTVLALVFWLAAGELVAMGVLGPDPAGIACQVLATAFSPWQAILEATRPYVASETARQWLESPVNLFVLVAIGLAAAINGLAVLRVRVWNPSSEMRGTLGEAPDEGAWRRRTEERVAGATSAGERTDRATAAAALRKTREVWDNPILWREMRTWAYGRKILVIRLAYLAIWLAAAGAVYGMIHGAEGLGREQAALVLAPLVVLSLVLVNAQAVTSLTSERDVRALDLLLVTDITPKEFVYGKLGGVFYNTKEMVLLPMLLCVYLWYARAMSLENLLYLLCGLAVLNVFAAMLGLHAGMAYESSRSAIATSLGTVFFLFVGVATCIRIMVAFSGSFQVQLVPFSALMLGGGVGLYVALGVRNPSQAIGWASLAAPFATFYAITSVLMGSTGLGFFVVLATYGFTTAAMLIPAVYEFDVATGRTTGGEEE
ncbi:MAG: ABC transporter permease [Pirellulales bacterium]